MKQEQELLKKQQLLIAEIIEQNYDQNEFENYLEQTAPEKTELDSWTFHDLQIRIVDFQKQKMEQQETKQQYFLPKVSKLFPNIQSQFAIPKISNQEKNKKQVNINDNFIEEFNENIPCKKEKYFIEKGQMLQFEIEVINCMNKSHSKFKITTNPFGWQVERTIGDFIKLQKILTQLHPELILRKCNIEEKTQCENLILTLTNFLQLFNKYDQIRTEIAGFYFLHGDLNNSQKSFDELTIQFQQISPYSLQNKQSPSELLNVTLTQKQYERYLQIQNYISQFPNKLSVVQQQFKQAIVNMSQAERSLSELTQSLALLLELVPFQELKETLYHEQLPYKAISYITEFQKTIQRTKKNMKDTLGQILNEMKHSVEAQSQTIENCETIKKQYVSYYKKFMSSQETQLKKKEIQQILLLNKQLKKTQTSQVAYSMPGVDYENLCLILRQELPLQVPDEFEEQQQKKLEFAFMIQETCRGVEKLYQEDTIRFSQKLDEALKQIILECDQRKQNAENLTGIGEYQNQQPQ